MWLSKSRRTERKKALEAEAKFEELTVELDHLRAELEQARRVPYRERLQDTRDLHSPRSVAPKLPRILRIPRDHSNDVQLRSDRNTYVRRSNSTGRKESEQRIVRV
jgi:hypothetical protein